VSSDAPPAVTEIGFAISVAVGGSSTTIATDAVRLVPAVPVHVSEKVVSSPSGPMLRLPAAAKVPLQPPDALQEVALDEDQVSVAEPPASIVVLDASRLAVGNAVTGAVAPPQPDNAHTAAIKQSEVSRMKSRSEFFLSYAIRPSAGTEHREKSRLCRPLHRLDSIMSLIPRTGQRLDDFVVP
jgi:hypothetical protein